MQPDNPIPIQHFINASLRSAFVRQSAQCPCLATYTNRSEDIVPLPTSGSYFELVPWPGSFWCAVSPPASLTRFDCHQTQWLDLQTIVLTLEAHARSISQPVLPFSKLNKLDTLIQKRFFLNNENKNFSGWPTRYFCKNGSTDRISARSYRSLHFSFSRAERCISLQLASPRDS